MLMLVLRVCGSRMNGSIEMLGWTIDSVKPKRFLAGVHNIMASTLRHNDAVIGFYFIGFSVYPDLAFSLFDPEKLITVIMDFHTDLVPRLEGHQHKLQIVAGVQYAAEVIILFRQSFDIVDKSLHLNISFRG